LAPTAVILFSTGDTAAGDVSDEFGTAEISFEFEALNGFVVGRFPKSKRVGNVGVRVVEHEFSGRVRVVN